MAAYGKSIVFVAGLTLATVRAIQVSPMDARRNRAVSSGEMQLIMLDDTEVANRGSHCLDGSTPGYLYKNGTEDDKWLFWFQGGAWCASEADCAEKVPLNGPADSMDALPLMETDAFSSYHHVYFPSCDFGLFLGDNPTAVDYKGTKLYFQGKRVMDHILGALQESTSFGSASEVLISGGSGGGQASYAIADYLSGVLPSSVQKFGAAPINGWYAQGEIDEIKYIYTLANMGNAVSANCKQAFSEEEHYKCIIPSHSYTYATAPIFMTQLFDYTFQKNTTLNEVLTTPYNNCLSSPTSSCSQEDVSLLQEHLNNVTEHMQNVPKFNGQGGFLSTCIDHVFYNDADEFKTFSNQGVTVGDAISAWWADLKNPSRSVKTYLPCSLGSPGSVQCESSCK